MKMDQSSRFRAATSLRVATIEDAGHLTKIAEKTFRDTYASANSAEDMNTYCTQHFNREQQALEILDQAKTTLLLERDGLLSGFAQLCWHKAPSCEVRAKAPSEILRFYLEQQVHGTGAAQALMNSVIEEAKKTDTDVLWLGVWAQNLRALAFYRKQGFVEIGEQSFQLGADHQRDLIMVTELY